MTRSEFFEFASLGTCDVFGQAMATAIYALMQQNSNYRVVYQQQPIRKVHSATTKPCMSATQRKLQTKCYAKDSATRIMHNAKCCDSFDQNSLHTVTIFQTDDGQTHMIDLSAFQFQIRNLHRSMPCYAAPVNNQSNFQLIEVADDNFSTDFWRSVGEDRLSDDRTRITASAIYRLCSQTLKTMLSHEFITEGQKTTS
jgi:hypothetical protein